MIGDAYANVMADRSPRASDGTLSPEREERPPPRRINGGGGKRAGGGGGGGGGGGAGPGRSTSRQEARVVEATMRRVADRQKQGAAAAAAADVGGAATGAAGKGKKGGGSSFPGAQPSGERLGFRAGYGASQFGTDSMTEEQRIVAVRVAARHNPKLMQPPTQAAQKADARGQEASARVRAEKFLEETALKSTWQFPHPAPVTDATKSMVPATRPPGLKPETPRKAPPERTGNPVSSTTANYNIDSTFILETKKFQGCFLHYFCIYNRKFRKNMASMLQLAAHTQSSPQVEFQG